MTKFGAIIWELGKISLLVWLLAYVVFGDANLSEAVVLSITNLFKAGIVLFAFSFGRYFADSKQVGWRSYLRVFYIVAIVTLFAWGTYGTHTEDGDPLYGGGETVVDFEPTR